MKYIRFEFAGFIIFEKTLNHSDIAKKFPDDKIISAGFMGLMIDEDQVQCYGESQSLNSGPNKKDNMWLWRRLSISA
jgi:hypothetical protein